jgi:ubiquinone biosynthesis protein COQ4
MLAQAASDTRLRPFQAAKAVRRLLDNPADTAQVFTVFRAMRGRSGIKAFRRFAASPVGASVLRERRCLLTALSDRAALTALPSGTLGRDYLSFMDAENLSADGLVQASQDWDGEALPPDILLFRERMRDSHDLTHVLTGYGREPLGETCLLAFMYAHTRNLGMAMIVAMTGSRLPRVARAAVAEAWRNGRKARWLPHQDWEALLPRSLDDIRREIGIADPLRYRAIVP